MTFVGRILVIVIMAFALFFLALTTVVFQTEQQWRNRVTALLEEKSKYQHEKQRLEGELADQTKNVDVAKKARADAAKRHAGELKNAQDEIAVRQQTITQNRILTAITLQETAKAQAEAEARIAEANVLRKNLETAQNQRDDFKLQRSELDQEILRLKRELEAAIDKRKNLRESWQLNGGELPPVVEGVVLNVDGKNQNVEISIGSNDGLKVGHKLDLFRLSPTPEYICKIQIRTVDVQQAVGRVIGKTLHGKKIQEGDTVSTRISPGG